MSRKTDKTSAPAAGGLLDSQLAQSIRESAQQIWLAGMGAFAKAHDGRAKVFEALIKEGTGLQRKAQAAAEDAIGEVAGRMNARAGEAQAKVGQHWDKLEGIFEQRTAKALNKLGVPTAKDVNALMQRVDELASAVAQLSRKAPGKAALKKAAAKQPKAVAAKKTAPRKTAVDASAAKKSPRRKRAIARG